MFFHLEPSAGRAEEIAALLIYGLVAEFPTRSRRKVFHQKRDSSEARDLPGIPAGVGFPQSGESHPQVWGFSLKFVGTERQQGLFPLWAFQGVGQSIQGWREDRQIPVFFP